MMLGRRERRGMTQGGPGMSTAVTRHEMVISTGMLMMADYAVAETLVISLASCEATREQAPRRCRWALGRHGASHHRHLAVINAPTAAFNHPQPYCLSLHR